MLHFSTIRATWDPAVIQFLIVDIAALRECVVLWLHRVLIRVFLYTRRTRISGARRTVDLC